MIEQIKVSVIMPVYNAAMYVENAINSVLNQSHNNIELIIINDGSTDSSKEIVQAIIGRNKAKDIKYFETLNLGQCSASNLGLRVAKGDYIQFLDADDIIDKDKIRNQLMFLSNYSPETTSICRWARVNAENTSLPNFNQPPPKTEYEPIEWLQYLWKESMMPNSGYLIPKQICDKSGYYIEHLTTNNDFEYFTKIVLNSKKVSYCEKSISYYRSVPNSLSQKIQFKDQVSVFEARKIACKYLLEKYPDDGESKKAVFYAIWHFIYSYRDNIRLLLQAYKFIKINCGKLKYHELSPNKYFKFICKYLGFKSYLVTIYILSRIRTIKMHSWLNS